MSNKELPMKPIEPPLIYPPLTPSAACKAAEAAGDNPAARAADAYHDYIKRVISSDAVFEEEKSVMPTTTPDGETFSDYMQRIVREAAAEREQQEAKAAVTAALETSTKAPHFTRMHYQAIADVLRRLHISDANGGCITTPVITLIAHAIGREVFAKDNPRFDWQRWLSACGVK